MRKRLLTGLLCLLLVGSLSGQVHPKWINAGELVHILKFKYQMLLKELSAAPTHTSGYGSLYVLSSDGRLYFKDDAGAVSGLEANYVNVQDYGATGDGVTDDAAAIFDAITAANGGYVLFPSGTFLCSTLNTKTFTTDIRIMGVGPEETVLDGNDVGIFYIPSGFGFEARDIKFYQFDDTVRHRTTSQTVSFVRVFNCVFDNSDNGIRVMAHGGIGYANIQNNRFSNLKYTGVALGNNHSDASHQDDCAKFIISNNEFEDIVNTDTNVETHAIFVFGQEVHIKNNIIDTVNSNGTSCEGIYTKAKYIQITGNTLIDAWNSSSDAAMIRLKGVAEDADTGMEGYCNKVSGNHLISTDAVDALGIYCGNSDTLISENILENCTIKTANNDISISNNKFKDLAMDGGHIISVYPEGGSATIDGNDIFGVSSASAATFHAIYVYCASNSESVSVTNNHVFIDGDDNHAGSNIYGISFYGDTTTLTSLSLHGNHVFVKNDGTPTSVLPLYFSGTLTITNRSDISDNYFIPRSGYDYGSATWNPGSIANGEEEAKEMTVTGAVLGDFAIASFSLDVADLSLTADITAANTATCVLANNTGGAINLAEGTIYVKVIKR